MTVAFANFGAYNSGASGTTVTPAFPASTAAGDLLVTGVSILSNATISTPAGWTAIGSQTNSGSGLTVAFFYRVFVGGDTAPAYTWTGAVAFQARVLRFTGASTVSPIGAVGTANATTGSPHTNGGLVTTAAESLIQLWDLAVGTTALGALTGWTTQSTAGTNGQAHYSKFLTASPALGATVGSVSYTGGTGAYVSLMFELLQGSTSVALTGVGATAAAGAAGIATGAPLVGAGVTADAGQLPPEMAFSIPGAGTSAAAGSLVEGAGFNLIGASASADAGSTGNAVSGVLPGAGITASAGAPLAGESLSLVGAGVAVSAGSLGEGAGFGLTGAAAISAAGSLLFSREFTLLGAAAVLQPGVLLTGVQFGLTGPSSLSASPGAMLATTSYNPQPATMATADLALYTSALTDFALSVASGGDL